MALTAEPNGMPPADAFVELREALMTKRRQLIESVGSELVAEPGGAAGSMGETEHLSFSEQRDVGLAIGAMHRKALVEVDEALARLDAGTYGLCEHCGAVIPRERLEVIPETASCVRCR